MSRTNQRQYGRLRNQLLAHISGGAGTGKSYIIRCLYELFGDRELCLSAPTGCAAFQIFGSTNHRAFRLPTSYIIGSQLEKLSGLAATELQETLKDIQVFIIDEKSMVGSRQLAMIDQRLREAFPENTDIVFGGKSVVLFGDYGQLPPVRDPPCYQQILNPLDTLASTGQMLYSYFERSVVLTDSVRQRNDREFDLLCQRLRAGVASDADYATLSTRFKGKGSTLTELRTTFKDAIYLFAQNSKVLEHNTARLHEIEAPIYRIGARHSGGRAASSASVDDARGLRAELQLAEGARVMLTSNEWTEAGLTNGSVGTVERIIFNDSNDSVPECIFVKFDQYIGPSVDSRVVRTVAIKPITATWQAAGMQLSRTQFPLTLAWAFSIHKAQGWTFDFIVIDVGPKEFAMALTYTAISRATMLSRLIIVPFTKQRFRQCANSQLVLLADRIRAENTIAAMDGFAPQVAVPHVPPAVLEKFRHRVNQRAAAMRVESRAEGNISSGSGVAERGSSRGRRRVTGRAAGGRGSGAEGNVRRGRGAVAERGSSRGRRRVTGRAAGGRGSGAEGNVRRGRGAVAERGSSRGRRRVTGRAAGGRGSGAEGNVRRGRGAVPERGSSRGRRRGCAIRPEVDESAGVSSNVLDGIRRGRLVQARADAGFRFSFAQHQQSSNLTIDGRHISDFNAINVRGDGNCLFRSLAFFFCGQDQSKFVELKRKLIAFSKSPYAPTCILRKAQFLNYATFNAYLKNTSNRFGNQCIEKENSWGDETDIFLFSAMTGVRINVVLRGVRPEGSVDYEYLYVAPYDTSAGDDFIYNIHPDDFPLRFKFPDYDGQTVTLYYDGSSHYQILN